MLVNQATFKAAQALREEEIKLRPATLTKPVVIPKVRPNCAKDNKLENKDEIAEKEKSEGTKFDEPLRTDVRCKTSNQQQLIMTPSRPQTSNMRDMSNDNEAEPSKKKETHLDVKTSPQKWPALIGES